MFLKLNPSGPDLRGMSKETIQEYLARGGEIHRFSAMPIHAKKGEVIMAFPLEKGNCLACVFYQGDDREGECHYFPPIAGKGFAVVSTQSWCSRFRTELGGFSRQTEKFQEVEDE